MRFRLSAVAVATGGERIGDDVEVDGASIDSRTVRQGQLFVPIMAERDGHDFVPAARDAGASAHLSSRSVDPPPGVRVGDTTEALSDLGRAARARMAGPVIGVTGSVGKTSVKDLLASVLETGFVTAASVRSFNNELGVPLTLLNAPDDVEAVVVEMGARGLGHIAELCDVAHPTVGIVTRIAAVHTSEFASVEEVAVAKGELVEALPADGFAILNADDEAVAALAERTDARVITYGTTAAAMIGAREVELDDQLRPSFDLVTPSGTMHVRLAVAGAHQVSNALAAAAAATAVGLPVERVAEGLAAGRLSPWRMETSRSASGSLIINDAYNANPTSVRAAFDALEAVDATRRIAVLGHMAELGPTSVADHMSIGREATERGFELVTVAADYGAGVAVEDIASALSAIGEIGSGTAVLVKASRVAGLEKLAAALLEL